LILKKFRVHRWRVLTWQQFVDREPDLAEAGRSLLYQFGVGLAFLATVGKDGFPRTHPVRPLISDGGLYVYIAPGPKLNDLRRDGRYALHCFPPVNNEDGFQLTGAAAERTDTSTRQRVDSQLMQESKLTELAAQHHDHPLFEFTLRDALVTRTTGHGDYNPQHSIWRLSE
jgi:hypothetical protein